MSVHRTQVKGGLPCLARIVHYHRQAPDRRADNDIDYNGYEELEFDLLTLKGKRAAWLDKCMSGEDEVRITNELLALQH